MFFMTGLDEKNIRSHSAAFAVEPPISKQDNGLIQRETCNHRFFSYFYILLAPPHVRPSCVFRFFQTIHALRELSVRMEPFLGGALLCVIVSPFCIERAPCSATWRSQRPFLIAGGWPSRFLLTIVQGFNHSGNQIFQDEQRKILIPIGFLKDILPSAAIACTAPFINKKPYKNHTMPGMVIGLTAALLPAAVFPGKII